ncbi:Protein TolQ [Candidatus Desulfarcum epimagneticum]|uniref:Protein TolQ n=1 Tax=uncultured Desulfobacteraceae bacterium TaxID=218296 RepID=A0A484HLF7_9BACT|nr:Protein TolQ [uncultured Desulfobacteraceae bacterium]
MFQEMDFIHMVLNAGLMVRFVLLTLLLFSIVSWTIIIAKFFHIRRAAAESERFSDFFWKSRSLSEAFSKIKRIRRFQKSPLAAIFQIGFLELKKMSQAGVPLSAEEAPDMSGRPVGLDSLERSLERAIRSEVKRMSHMAPFLATSGNTTPFIGLFGTVWGIMNSFHGIGIMGSANLAVVAPGISEALVATAAGLAVAIPSVIAYNYFINKIRVMESDMRNFSSDFINIVQRDMLRPKAD